MAVSFAIPESPKRNVYTMNVFSGCDFTNSPAAVDDTKSPNCVNMIRDVPGKVRKCMGYRRIEEYDDAIYGFHSLHNSTKGLVHSGKKLIYNGSVVFNDMNERKSKSWQFDNKLYIIDGKNYLRWDGTKIEPVEDFAYIPTLTIACNPDGGGTAYENLNLLQSGFQEWFYSTATSTAYHLTFANLDSKEVKVKVLVSDGVWQDKKEGVDFSVDRTNGVVNFVKAPGTSPVTGEDNVKITAFRTVEGYANRVKKCKFGTRYGVNGNLNRLFLSGNDDLINYDWWSQTDDPSYFPDLNYATIGSSSSAVVGYSIINSYLATFKDDRESENNIVLRKGELINEDKEARFSTVSTLQGAPAIVSDTFGYLASEPLYLSRLGVYAITSLDQTGEKYGQLRSFFLNGKLLKEPNLDKAFAFVYKDFYWLCVNGVAYILDGLQPLMTDKSSPYSTRQFAGFYRTNIPATCMWENDGELYFGTSDGRICEFYNDKESAESYNDDGEPIECYWETPDIDGKLFYKNKTFRYLAVRLQSAVRTSIKIYAMKSGLWSLLAENDTKAKYLSFSHLIFSKFTFSSDQSQKIIAVKTRIKKVDKTRYRFYNAELNEPFGIFDIGIEYVQNGNVK